MATGVCCKLMATDIINNYFKRGKQLNANEDKHQNHSVPFFHCTENIFWPKDYFLKLFWVLTFNLLNESFSGSWLLIHLNLRKPHCLLWMQAEPSGVYKTVNMPVNLAFLFFPPYGLKLNCESWEDAVALVCSNSNSVFQIPSGTLQLLLACQVGKAAEVLGVSRGPTWFSCWNWRWTRTKCLSLNVPQFWVGLDPDQDLNFLCLRLVSNWIHANPHISHNFDTNP